MGTAYYGVGELKAAGSFSVGQKLCQQASAFSHHSPSSHRQSTRQVGVGLLVLADHVMQQYHSVTVGTAV